MIKNLDRPDRGPISPEKEQKLKYLAEHESGHIIVSNELNIPIQIVMFNLEKNEGGVIWHSLKGVSEHQQAVVYAAGFAAELKTGGSERIKSSDPKNFFQDSRFIHNLGYKTQEEKARLVEEATKILDLKNKEFSLLAEKIRDKLVSGFEKGLKEFEITGEEVKTFL